ncbi:MAG: radical SAM protein [Thermodesulfobacteriota bacterium]|nr:radical SAM protein [Thermodesulfobacteriota bacterium]
MSMLEKGKIQKVLLIQPPLTTHTDLSSEPKGIHPPIGLAYIGAVLESDYEVQIIDSVVEGYETEIQLDRNLIRYGLTFKEIQNRIEAFQPDVVGVSNSFSSGFREALQVSSLVKKLSPDIITVIGGPHPSALPEEVLSHKEIDFAVLGEGEYSFKDLLRGIEKNDFSELDGVAFKNNGKVDVIAKTKFIINLDELPFPARHLLPMEKYFEIGEAFIVTRKKPFTPLNTSRGCVARCTFCPVHATWGGRWRPRSADNVLDEIEHLVKTYGVKEIHFDDDNLVLNRKRAQKIFQGIIDRKLDIVWTVPTGLALWAVDHDLLGLMKKSGCYKLFVAVESGDEYILRKVIQKPLDLRKVKPLVKTMKSLDIEVESFFVAGMPGETVESLKRTFNFARELDIDATHYFFANPMPGTILWDMCVENNYFRNGFSLEKIRVERANIETPQLSAKELERMVAREQLISRILPLLMHPRRMTKKYLSYLKKDRRIVYNFILKNVCQSLKKEPNSI